MPKGDGTGPLGQGPKTGGGKGQCGGAKGANRGGGSGICGKGVLRKGSSGNQRPQSGQSGRNKGPADKNDGS